LSLISYILKENYGVILLVAIGRRKTTMPSRLPLGTWPRIN